MNLNKLIAKLNSRLWACELNYLNSLVAIFKDGPDPTAQRKNRSQVESGVLQLNLMGLLMARPNWVLDAVDGTAMLPMADQIIKAIEREDVRSAVMVVDSPGGTIQGTTELSNAVKEFAQAKPFQVQVVGDACSAAYWIATSGTTIEATEGSVIGSIGVYAIHADTKQLNDSMGINVEVVRKGTYKALNNPHERLTEQGRNDMQRQVDDAYDRFVEHVAEGRGVTVDTVENRFGQGRVYTATEAKSRGMIDFVRGVPSMPQKPDEQNQATTETEADSQAFDQHVENVETSSAPVAAIEHTAGQGADLPAAGPVPAAGSDGADSLDTPESREVIEARERDRVLSLQQLSNRLSIPADMASASIQGGESIETAINRWMRESAVTDQRVRPASRTTGTGQIRPVRSEFDRYADAATKVLMNRALPDFSEKLDQEAQGMAWLSPHDIAKRALQLAGRTITNVPEEDAAAFFQIGSGGMMGGPSMQPHMQPGDFPNVLSNLANRMLDAGFAIAPVTFRAWSARWPDASDFRPRVINRMGLVGNLEAIADGEKPPEVRVDETNPEYYQVTRHGLIMGLTPMMYTQDDMGAFAEGMIGLGIAHDQTINDMAISLLNMNPTMADGNALFSAEHGNLVSAGAGLGAPSDDSYSEMRRLQRLQIAPGSRRRVNYPSRVALIPAQHEQAARKTLAPMQPDESKAANTDANINTVRGSLEPAIEGGLDAYSTDAHYTFKNVARPFPFGYAYMTGYGQAGRRRSWFDPATETRWFKLEGRFTFFAVTWIGAIKNNGA